MDKEEFMKNLDETYGVVFDMQEYMQMQLYQIIRVLLKKQIISQDDYEKYLSIDAINKLKEAINKEIGEE